jgi:hypothetical protein
MHETQSYSALEHAMKHGMRRAINGAQDAVDLGNQFSYAAADFLRKAFTGMSGMIRQNDVMFSSKPARHFAISSRLLEMPEFSETWKHSDLPGIIGRFAESAYHRFLHLERHTEKTNLKIRN